jgi:hypothetical protein
LLQLQLHHPPVLTSGLLTRRKWGSTGSARCPGRCPHQRRLHTTQQQQQQQYGTSVMQQMSTKVATAVWLVSDSLTDVMHEQCCYPAAGAARVLHNDTHNAAVRIPHGVLHKCQEHPACSINTCRWQGFMYQPPVPDGCKQTGPSLQLLAAAVGPRKHPSPFG